MGDKTEAVSSISFRGIVALVTMRNVLEQLAGELPGPWQEYFSRLAARLTKYRKDVEDLVEVPLTREEIQVFELLADDLRRLPNFGAPVAGVRISLQAATALASLGDLFDDHRARLPWNGERLAQALASFKAFGEKTPSSMGRCLISYDALRETLKGVEIAVRMAVIQMRKEMDRIS